jgi:hypothetical protein
MKPYWICGLALITAAWAQEPSGLPNPQLTPGAINPDVMQGNIHSTICVANWTKKIRPPASYTNKLKQEQIAQYGYADKNVRDYEEDHFISLEIGGNPTDPKNLWPEPYAGEWGARKKDQLEDTLHRLVCSGAMTVDDARTAITSNWITAYQKYVH